MGIQDWQIVNEDGKFYLNLRDSLLMRRDLKPIDKLVWTYLDFRQGQNDDCWPGTERISHDLGVSRQTVIDSIKRLEGNGDINVTPSKGGRSADGRPATNHYVTVKNLDSKGRNLLSRNHFLLSKNPKSTVKKSFSTVQNLDTITNIKTNTEKKQKNKSYSFFSKELISELINRHIELSPVANSGKHRRGLLGKCRKLLERHGAKDIRDTIERYSSRGTEGDGWGIVVKMISMIDNVRAEENYQLNLAADQQAQAERERQPVKIPFILRRVSDELETDEQKRENFQKMVKEIRYKSSGIVPKSELKRSPPLAEQIRKVREAEATDKAKIDKTREKRK